MNQAVVYIHGQGGSPREAEHYRPLFPDADVIGLAYHADTPWAAKTEFVPYFETLRRRYRRIWVIANSIGAYFAMRALADAQIDRAWLISPVVDMEQLICGMMAQDGVSEARLQSEGQVKTSLGQTLSWEYLRYVRQHPIRWSVPTAILYGNHDELTKPDAVFAFAKSIGAKLTVMDGGEHWFHTEEQMRFLDDWIRKGL